MSFYRDGNPADVETGYRCPVALKRVAWLVALLSLLGAGCETERVEEGGGGDDERAVVVTEFEYLPDEGRMVVTATAESTVVERWNGTDSSLGVVRKANADTARLLFDSLLTSFARVSPGTYKKDQVLDGTRITIRYRNQRILCDNCLHDFVLEAVGVASGGAPKSAYLIRDVVGCVGELVLLADGERPKGMRRTTVILDKQLMQDTTRAYEIDTTTTDSTVAPKEKG